MLKGKVYNQSGKELRTIDLPEFIFGVETNIAVIHQAVAAQLGNSRQVLAHAKTRAEVRGGGRKPWRQKGTGRARHGSTRSPIWIGGGITFGPTKERNFSKRINKKMRRKAIFMVLSDRLAAGDLKFVDKIDFPQIKTKKAADLLNDLRINKALFIIDEHNRNFIKSCANLPKAAVIDADSLNVIDLLNHKDVIMTENSVDKIVSTYKMSSKDDQPKASEKAEPKVKKTVKSKK
ncbi:MAG: 50S ribosomal protein L4 [Patescibacteria group bacterium]